MAFRFTDTRFEPFQPTRRPNVNFDFGASTAIDRNKILPQPEEDPYAGLMNLQDGPAKQAYKDFLAEPDPRKEDFKPTKMNRLAAILSGASDGLRRGAGAGFETAQAILNRPYDEAMGERVRRAKQLEAGYKVEDGDFKDKVLAAKTALDSKKFDANEARNERLDALNEKNVNSQIKARDNDEASKGWTSATDLDGFRIYTRIGPSGESEYKDTGIKVGQSPGEKMVDTKEMARYTSGLTENRQFNYFKKTNPVTSGQADKRNMFNIAATGQRQISGQNFQRGMFDQNPTNQFNLESLARQHAIQDNPGLEDDFDEKGRPTTPRARALMREHIELLKRDSGTPGVGDPSGFRILEVTPD